jgi:Carboxypeptidase regulatory-like domain
VYDPRTPFGRWFSLTPIIPLLACVAALAQANSELSGIVTDPAGAVIRAANITLTDPATGLTRTTQTDSIGLYDLNGLNPATYNLQITARGFESFVQNGIVVNVSATTRVDVHLTVGAESQTVIVNANSLAVQTDSNVISNVISSDQITEIATENRNFAALAALGLGVSSNLPDNNTPTSVSSSFALSFNGLRPSHNIWLIDGGEADDRGGGGSMDVMPSQDAIAEFTVMSSNYPPDYGISSGATSRSRTRGEERYKHLKSFDFTREKVGGAGRDRTGA